MKVKRNGREQTVWTQVMDPLGHPPHTRWIASSVDLTAQAGRGAELILETRGLRAGRRPRARLLGRARAHHLRPGDGGAAGHRLSGGHPARGPHHSPTATRATPRPSFWRFARDAVVFEQAIAHASWTKPSVASIFTSQLPGRHRAVQLRDPLDSGLVTLRRDAEGEGLRHRRLRWRTSSSTATAPTSSRASTTSRGSTAPTTGPPSAWTRPAWWTMRWAGWTRGAASPTSTTCT